MKVTGRLKPIVDKARGVVGNRRGSPRLPVRLRVRAVLSDGRGKTLGSADGQTRDVSAGGVGLVLPERLLGGGAARAPKLVLTLRLGRRDIRLTIKPVRRVPAPLEPGSVFVGGRIEDITDEDRAVLASFIRARRFPARDVAPLL